MYPKSLYKDGVQRVAFCGEEHAARTADGWSDSRPAAAVTPILDPRSPIGESAVERRHESAETPIASADDTASTISEPEAEAPPQLLVNPIPPVVQKLRTRKA